MREKIKILLFASIPVLFLIVIFNVFSTPKVDKSPQKKGIIEKQTPTKPSEETFSIVKVEPENKVFSSVEKVKITFSHPVDKSTILFDVEPKTSVTASFDSSLRVLTIEPIEIWSFDTDYTITFSKETTSINGLILGEDSQIRFNTVEYSGI